MTLDTLTFIAGARQRRVPEATLARWLGLRDGQAGYTTLRQDALRTPVAADPPKPAPAPVPMATRASEAQNVPVRRLGLIPDPTVRGIVAAVEVAFELPPGRICGYERDRFTSRARYAAVRIIHKRLGLSSVKIAERMGSKHHTSILKALKRARDLMADPAWRARYEAAEAALTRKVGG